MCKCGSCGSWVLCFDWRYSRNRSVGRCGGQDHWVMWDRAVRCFDRHGTDLHQPPPRPPKPAPVCIESPLEKLPPKLAANDGGAVTLILRLCFFSFLGGFCFVTFFFAGTGSEFFFSSFLELFLGASADALLDFTARCVSCRPTELATATEERRPPTPPWCPVAVAIDIRRRGALPGVNTLPCSDACLMIGTRKLSITCHAHINTHNFISLSNVSNILRYLSARKYL